MYFRLRAMRSILAWLCLLILSSCCTQPAPPETALPAELSDQTLYANLLHYFETAGAPVSSRYTYHRTDLDQDGRRDAIVLMRAPYGYWCNEDGCKMLVLRALNDRFDLISAIEPVREPVFLSNEATMGWRDIIVRLSGRREAPKDVALRFDGRRYPPHPDLLEGSPRSDLSAYERIFNDEGIR